MVKTFTLAKDSVAPESNEDAVAVGTSRLALADGASSDAFAGLWAQTLCQQYLAVGALERDTATAIWTAALPQPLPWFLADKLRQPTHASFLGLAWEESTLHIQAVGDACVFVIRDSALALAFPYTRADDFATHPALVPTQGPLPEPRRAELPLLPGDTVLAATDALAAWLLHEQAHQPWHSLLALQNAGDFARFVQALRTAKRIALDDTTLVVAAPDTTGS